MRYEIIEQDGNFVLVSTDKKGNVIQDIFDGTEKQCQMYLKKLTKKKTTKERKNRRKEKYAI